MKKIAYLKPLSLLIACLCVVSFGFGQSIFTNPISGTNPNTDDPYTTGQITDTNITVSGIGRGAGISGNPGSNRYNASSWDTGSIDLSAYFEFTITPNSGYEINFSNFVYTSQRSNTSISNFAFRSSVDGYTSDIGTPLFNGATIDLSGAAYQNITSAITFRVYAWGAGNVNNTFSINDFTFNGSVLPGCFGLTTTWNGATWDNGTPDLTISAIINGDYDTNTNGDLNVCSLTVNSGFTLNIADNTFVEVQNDATVDGSITVQNQGAFVQRGVGSSAGTFSLSSGSTLVNKTTRSYNDDGLHYVYWSAPVTNADITTVFPNPDKGRRYSFNASLFLDQHTVGTTNGTPDDIDDNDNDWETATGPMAIGHGYLVAASAPPPVPSPFPYADAAQFSGEFNTGDVFVTVYRNDDELNDSNWNFLGNPYPSAISTDDFFAVNGYNATLNPTGTIDNILYLWTHNSLADSANPGNQASNFSQDDYAYINLVAGVQAVSGGDIPNKFVPSCQGFFVAMSNDVTPTGGSSPVFSGTVEFNNDMRRADGTSNSQFFKNSRSKKESVSNDNKLWVNLTSDNGVFNQVALGYVDGATNNDDGVSYDAKRIITENTASILYTIIDGSDKKFAIQGKAINSLTNDEVIKLGFKTIIDVATLYKLSVAQLQGDFLNNNTIYLKDNLLDKLHDLSATDYTFTSEIGEFNDRFEIVFNANALSTDDISLDKNSLSIVELDNDRVQFKTSNNSSIKTVNIFDLLGRQLYLFEGKKSSETYTLLNLNSSIYIAEVVLSNGAVITKKAVKK